jgi:hypothetical protein
MRSLFARACGLLVLSGTLSVQTAAQSEPVSVEVAPFRSVELRHGGRVVLRYGATQRVTFLRGSPEHTRVTVAPGGELLIEKCKRSCGRGYDIEVEILTPEVARVTVAQGGMIQTRGSFPRQAEIRVDVDNGGGIDIRSMSVGSVTASVLSGGRIYVRPFTAMVASVVDGGNITYWGDARITQSIQRGGVITKGEQSDADQPLWESSPAIAPIPAVPPLPPTKPRRYLWL